MAKRPDSIPEKLRVWMEAGKRHHLSHAHIQMAKEARNAKTASARVPDLKEIFIELEGDRDIPF